MAAAELPSFYGQRTRDGTVIQPTSRKGNGTPAPMDMAEKPVNPGLNEAPMFATSNPRPRRPGMTRMISGRSVQESIHELRLPWTTWMNSEAKNHFVAFTSEFIGTTLFLFFAFAGTQVANIGANSNQSTTGAATGFNPTVYLYIAICFGFSLMVNAWVFFRVSGGLFNPAVTLALCLLKAIGPRRAVVVFIAQLTGACFAAYLVQVIFPTPLNVRTTLAGGTSLAQGIFIEALCTAELVFTIIMLAMEKHKATFIAPIGIGLSLFIGELVGVFYTGGSLNPARSFGPSAVTHTFSHNDWIYWVGPLMGSLFAVAFYRFIKVLEYEMANPGQDNDGLISEANARAKNKYDMENMTAHQENRAKEDRDAAEQSRTVEEGRAEDLAEESDDESVDSVEHGRGGEVPIRAGENGHRDSGDVLTPQTSPTALLTRMKRTPFE